MAPVHEAAKRNDVEDLRRLLDEDPGLIEAGGMRTPLYCAARAGSVEAARLLLERDADTFKPGGFWYSPLRWACCRGQAEIVKMLLEHGADPTIRPLNGNTVLMMAATTDDRPGSDYVAVIRLLIKDGRVEVDAYTLNGCTALYLACEGSHTERARVLLLEGRANHNLAEAGGWTPMDVATSASGCIELLEWYEDELDKAAMLSKARAVVDDTESISKAPEKMGAKTEGEVQQAREEAAPAYLRGRVEAGEALPAVEVAGQAGQHDNEDDREREEERHAVVGWLVRQMAGDLYVEMMEGLWYRRWFPEAAEVVGEDLAEDEIPFEESEDDVDSVDGDDYW